MLKTISAALLVASVFVAPAMASSARIGHAPAIKSVTTTRSVLLNANARMGRHHHHHRHFHRHHRFYKHR